jgi:hypothetical protein
MNRISPPRHQGHQAHPPTLQRRSAKAQRCRGDLARFLPVVRSWPSSNDGQRLLGRDTGTNASVRHGFPTQQPALRERRSRHSPSLFIGWEGHAFSPKYGNVERQNRRAKGTSAGEKAGSDGRLHSEQTGFSPATGDSIACRSTIKKRNLFSRSAFASLRFSWCPPLVSWCLGGFSFSRPSEHSP